MKYVTINTIIDQDCRHGNIKLKEQTTKDMCILIFVLRKGLYVLTFFKVWKG